MEHIGFDGGGDPGGGEGGGRGDGAAGKLWVNITEPTDHGSDVSESVSVPPTPDYAVIVDSQLEKNESQKFTVYKIVVTAGGRKFNIYRRYNDFFALHSQVCKSGMCMEGCDAIVRMCPCRH